MIKILFKTATFLNRFYVFKVLMKDGFFEINVIIFELLYINLDGYKFTHQTHSEYYFGLPISTCKKFNKEISSPSSIYNRLSPH